MKYNNKLTESKHCFTILSTMSLCAAIAWSHQSSTFSQDPYNTRYINSLVKGKQTKPENKQFYG